VDARTEITANLLSKAGFSVSFTDDEGEDQETTFRRREFEKRFFSDATNQLLCKTFLEHALRDPVSGEIGKSIVFAVSQNHAAKLAQVFNQMADRMFPGRYQSDFAVQVTSSVPDAQQFTVNFANNNLLGSGNFIPAYKTSKARVCVTVGMMTTGYDCTDILNLGLFRPIFSPTDFIQIKGRGTRKHDFLEQLYDAKLKESLGPREKASFKLFDFFANCEYFEEEYNYDEILELPRQTGVPRKDDKIVAVNSDIYEHRGGDILATIREETVGLQGMKVDRMFFEDFGAVARKDAFIARAVEFGMWDQVIDYVNKELFDKPEQYFTLEKLRGAADVDRRLSLREILEYIFGRIPRFKSKDELLEEEFAKFVADCKPEEATAIPAIKNFFKAYITQDTVRKIVDNREYTDLATHPAFTTRDFKAVPPRYRALVPEYIRDYVLLNQFT